MDRQIKKRLEDIQMSIDEIEMFVSEKRQKV